MNRMRERERENYIMKQKSVFKLGKSDLRNPNRKKARSVQNKRHARQLKV